MQCVRFLHIPKTAGSTFERILARQYDGVGHFGFSGDAAADLGRFTHLSEQEKGSIGLFTGHAPISTGISEADKALIITFLRDPVHRVKSFCQHVAEGKSPYLSSDFPPDGFDLDKFINSGNLELSNLQTKMLINDRESASSELIGRMSPSEARDRALENLFGKVSHFGLQEFFNDSLLLFWKALAWSPPAYSSMDNQASDELVVFKEHHLDHIKDLNSIDIEVYSAAKTRFLYILEGFLG